MTLNVGVNVREVDGLAAPALQAAPTSIAAFLGRAERGVPNRPIRVSNSGQYQTSFGNYRADSYLAYAVAGFFLNGGQAAHIVRIVGAGSQAATAALPDRQSTPSNTLRVEAAFRNQLDPGEWGNRLRIDVRDDARGRTQLMSATLADSTSAIIDNSDGFTVGSVARFVVDPSDASLDVYRRLTAVDTATNTVRWDANNPIVDALAVNTPVMTTEFRLLVRYQMTPTAPIETVEDWRRLSMESDSADYAPLRVNHAFTGSRYVRLIDISGSAAHGLKTPAVISNHPLTNGSEIAPAASDYAGNVGQRTGLQALNTTPLQLLAVPDAHHVVDAGRDAIVQSVLDYCAERGDCMYVGSAPDRAFPAGRSPRSASDYTQTASDYLNQTLLPYAANFHGRKVYGALYAAWIRVLDPIGAGPAPSRFIPADGHVMGVYARTDRERGVWKAPAGNAAQVRGALELSATLTDAEHTALVRQGHMNGIRRQTGVGIIVAASRTLSTDTRWWFINVRLLFNFIKSTLRDGLRFVRQEPHTEELRRLVRFNVITPFLLGLWRQGAFGSDSPSDVFSVKCDVENNPLADVDQGIFRVEVYFYPVKPAETILIVVGQRPSGASASDA